MPTTHNATRSTAAPSDRPTIETRIDAAHTFGDPPAATPVHDSQAPLDTPAAANIEAAGVALPVDAARDEHDLAGELPASIDFVQLRIHARQIATQLKSRKDDVDRREAQVAQQLADLERAQRQARLQLDELQQSVAERETKLAQREQTYIERIEQLVKLDDPTEAGSVSPVEIARFDDPRLIAVAELFRRWHDERRAMTAAHDELRRQREQLEQERHRLEQDIVQQRETAMRSVHAALEQVEKRRETLDRRESALEQAEIEWSQRQAQPTPSQRELADSLACREEMIGDREEQLNHGEEQLHEALGQVQRLREEVRLERERLEGQARLDRQRLLDEHRRREAELVDKRRIVDQLADEMHARRAAVEAEHDEVLRLHRETLELRLATEELWNHLVPLKSSAELTQALGQTRQRLSDQYRLEAVELDRRKGELDELREQLSGTIGQLTERQQQLSEWLQSRQGEIDRVAATLVQRERELHTKGLEQRQAEQTWQRQRMELEQELRRARTEVSVLKLRQPAV